MFNLYNRTAQHLAEEYLLAMKSLENSTAAIANAESLAIHLTHGGIPTEAVWQIGAGCLLRAHCAIEVIAHTIEQITLALAMEGYGMVESGQANTWVLVDVRENATAHTIHLIIEEF